MRLKAGLLYMRSRGPCNAGKVPLQQSVVLHNVSSAAGDDASHHHARDETPTLRTGPRGAAGIDNGDAYSHVQIHIRCSCAHAHRKTQTHTRINAFRCSFFYPTQTPKNPNTGWRGPTISA